MTVTLTPGPAAGGTTWVAADSQAHPTAPHHVAVDVRPDAFVDHYFTTVAAYGA